MRRMTAALSVIATLGAPLPAGAQTDVPNAAPLEACVAAAGASRAALEACKSVIAEPCIETPGGETTAGLVQCYGAEANGWRALLEGAVARAMNDAARRDLLTQSQQAWTDWREHECRYQASFYAGGTLARVVAAHCVAELTADRAIAFIYAERIEP